MLKTGRKRKAREFWAPIPDFDDYEFSTAGNCRRGEWDKSNRFPPGYRMKPFVQANKVYYRLIRNGTQKALRVKDLLYEMFRIEPGWEDMAWFEYKRAEVLEYNKRLLAGEIVHDEPPGKVIKERRRAEERIRLAARGCPYAKGWIKGPESKADFNSGMAIGRINEPY